MVDSENDVFISYRHKDAGQVRALAAAMRAAGVRVWIDEVRIEDFASIQGNIEKGLSQSKALLAWYSADYPGSRACQWELTTAFLAAQQDGDVRRRIFCINPEDSAAHIYPLELRDALYPSVPGAVDALQSLVDLIGQRVQQLPHVLGDIRTFAKPQWHGGASGYGSNRFVGRVQELWEIHSALQASAIPIITGTFARPLVQLVGIGGAGKSLIAEEYALRFGAAYPGGIYWLKAFGHDNAAFVKPEEREAERQRQFRHLAQSVGIGVTDLPHVQLRAQLAETLKERGAYLWVVDDLPSGMSWDSAEAWMAPTHDGHTLVTSRAGAHDWAGKLVEIVELEPDAAYALLTHRRPPRDEQEAAEAKALTRELGYHALALELAAALAQRRGYTDVRSRLADRSKDVLDFAADLFGARGGTLPHREAVDVNISRTLLVTIEALNSGMDFLRLAAQLAPAPILREVVALAFAAADGLSAADADDRADLALAEAESNSLARPVLGTAVVVHTLVSRTVRFRDAAQDRQRSLRQAACDAFATIIQTSTRSWEGKLPTDVAHAETLISSMLEAGADLSKDEAKSLVLLLQELYPYTPERGAFWHAALKICSQVLGEENPTTLIAMNRRAVWLYAFGGADEALDLQEKVFELSRSTLGDGHVDTRIALQNLKETIYDRCDQFRSHDLKEYTTKLQALLREVPLGGGGNERRTFMNNPV